MFKRKKEEKISIKKLLSSEENLDSYILDNQNVIVSTTNYPKSNDIVIIHKRLIDNKLIEINRWNNNAWNLDRTMSAIQNTNLCLMMINSKTFNTVYDYNRGVFVVRNGVWNFIVAGDYITNYNGLLASFILESPEETDDYYEYINPVTNEHIKETFKIKDVRYYAMLNLDGTIRGNKLFKGTTFSKIERIIDLNEYSSLEEFKRIRIEQLNEIKNMQKQEYYRIINNRNNGSISPYLDMEVAQVIGLKRAINNK